MWFIPVLVEGFAAILRYFRPSIGLANNIQCFNNESLWNLTLQNKSECSQALSRTLEIFDQCKINLSQHSTLYQMLFSEKWKARREYLRVRHGCVLDRPLNYSDVRCLNYTKGQLLRELAPTENSLGVGVGVQKAILLFGPRGTGKTELLQATSKEMKPSGYTTYWLSAHELKAKYSKLSAAARISDNFARARRNSPAIVTIDDVDELRDGDGVRSALIAELNDKSPENANVFVVATAANPAWHDTRLIAAFPTILVLWLPREACRSELTQSLLEGRLARADSYQVAFIARRTANYSRLGLEHLIDDVVRRESHGWFPPQKLTNETLRDALERGIKTTEEECDQYVQWLKTHKPNYNENDTKICDLG